MYESAEQFVALNRANSARFVGIALESAGRLFELQLKTAKNAVADLAQQINTLNDVKDPQEIAQLKTTFVPAIMEKATSYVKSVYDIAAATQSEINRLFEAQMGQLNKQVMTSLDKAVKSGPAGSEATIAAVKSAITVVNSAYDNLSKSAKQIAELAEANVEAVTAQTPHATRKKTA